MSAGSLRIVGRCFIMTYQDQLQDPRWIAKRNEILERDDYCCQDCLRGKDRLSPHIQLHVHHRKYIDGLMAWEYTNDQLITLCRECHGKFHGKVPDARSDREKPTFVYGENKFERRPTVHIKDAMLQMIQSMING